MDQIILVDKPSGWTSFDVVAKVRGILSKQAGKKVKVGHSGTLDPFATGLLVLASGKKTKQLQELTGLDKTYEATLKLGFLSTTGDPEGEVTSVASNEVSETKIMEALKKFLGDIQQIPPAHSAIKVNGKRAYELARQGKEVKLEPRLITVYEIELIDYRYPFVKFSCRVSKGTYIRVLAEDIARHLDTAGYLIELRRTTVGEYKVEDAKLPDEIIFLD